MVYTVTFNPSLDYIVEVKSFELGMTNRTSYEHMLPGGKGINVSIVLNNLEFDTTAFGSNRGGSATRPRLSPGAATPSPPTGDA